MITDQYIVIVSILWSLMYGTRYDITLINILTIRRNVCEMIPGEKTNLFGNMATVTTILTSPGITYQESGADPGFEVRGGAKVAQMDWKI